MLICTECGRTFERPQEAEERHGLDMPPYEKISMCPFCGGVSLRNAYPCSICGGWITDSHIITLDGQRICDGCYIRYEGPDD